MDGPESKEYSKAWVTVDQALSLGPCELLYAVVYGVGSSAQIYNNDNAGGETVATIQTENDGSAHFNPPKPVYCRQGLYVDVTAADVGDGVFVQWRELNR